jgi:hypothetical protein
VIDPARKTEELLAHVESLGRELEQWRAAADGDQKPLRRHFTQIESLAGTLGELAAGLRTALAGADGNWVFETASGIERRVLDLHRVWGFFRDKLALRYVTFFADALLVADDLAWACYQPAQRFIPPGRRREPPLVYFSGGSTPHLMPRGTPYVVAPLPNGGLSPPKFAELVEGMPVALIGLPWFEVERVADLAVVAHEVGHAVERDLALERDVEALVVGAVDAAHTDAWRAWRQEVFADIYGVLALGPSYAYTLAGLLAMHPRDIVTETARTSDGWKAYPTRTLRVQLAAAALCALGLREEGRAIARDWRMVYSSHAYREFERDVPRVVAALLNTEFPLLGDKPLTDVMRFGASEQRETKLVKEQLRNRLAPSSAERIRPLIAGARLAHEDPGPRYDAARASEPVRVRARQIQIFGRRAAGTAADVPSAGVRAERDRLAGLRLAALLNEEDPDVQTQQA